MSTLLPNKIPSITLRLHTKTKAHKVGYIRVCVNVAGSPMPVRKSLGHQIPVEYWDAENEIVKRPYPKADEINDLCRTYVANLRTLLHNEAKAGTRFTRDVIEAILNPNRHNGCFIHFFQQHLAYLRAKWSHNYTRSYNTSLNTFIAFVGPTIHYSRITTQLLQQYETFMRTGDKAKKIKPLANNTIYLRTRHLHEVITMAIAQNHITPAQVAQYTWPSYVEPDKDYLTLTQTENLWKLITSGQFTHDPQLHLVAVYFLLECYSGIRVSDWGRWTVETIIDTPALKVRARKNGEPVYLFLDQFTRLAAVIDYIHTHNLTFNLAEQTANRALKTIGAHIGARIKITTHTGRHTFGTLLAALGYSSKEIADLMGVSEETAKIYAKNTRQSVRAAQQRYGGL